MKERGATQTSVCVRLSLSPVYFSMWLRHKDIPKSTAALYTVLAHTATLSLALSLALSLTLALAPTVTLARPRSSSGSTTPQSSSGTRASRTPTRRRCLGRPRVHLAMRTPRSEGALPTGSRRAGGPCPHYAPPPRTTPHLLRVARRE